MNSNPYITTHTPIWQSAQWVAIGTTSATASAQFPAATGILRVCATADCWINAVGSASAGQGSLLPKNVIEYVDCVDGSSTLSILAVSTAGNISITPCSA